MPEQTIGEDKGVHRIEHGLEKRAVLKSRQKTLWKDRSNFFSKILSFNFFIIFRSLSR